MMWKLVKKEFNYPENKEEVNNENSLKRHQCFNEGVFKLYNDMFYSYFNLAGVDKEDIKVLRKGNTLCFDYVHKLYEHEPHVKASFDVLIPEEADLSTLDISYKNGVIIIKIKRYTKDLSIEDPIEISLY